MSTTVHVILSGIISLIPHGELDDGRPAGWTVRLQHAGGHEQSLVVEETAIVTQPYRPDEQCTLTDGMSLVGWRLLDPEDRDTPKPGTLVIANTFTNNDPLQLPPLSDVLEVKDGCENERCAHARLDLAESSLELEIVAGALETTTLEGGRWRFKPRDQDAKSIAEEVCYSFEIEEDELQLDLKIDGKTYRWVLKARSASSDIELRLQNLPSGSLFPELARKGRYDDHADLYFDHSADPPTDRPRLTRQMFTSSTSKPAPGAHPHRLADTVIGPKNPGCHVGASTRGLRVNCPPAQWMGYDDF